MTRSEYLALLQNPYASLGIENKERATPTHNILTTRTLTHHPKNLNQIKTKKSHEEHRPDTHPERN